MRVERQKGMGDNYSQVRDAEFKMMSQFSAVLHAGLLGLVNSQDFCLRKIIFKAAIKLTVPLDWVYFFLNCPLLQPNNKAF